MTTPIAYKNDLKEGNITEEALSNVIYSYNKRAKNMRDKEKEYKPHYVHDIYGNKESYKEKKEHYYECKSALLSILTPSKIHIVTREKKESIGDNDGRFDEIPASDIIYRGVYFDKYENREVEYIQAIVKEDEYFLYYEIAGKSFHHPIDKIDEYNLPVEHLSKLITHGEDTALLLSVQFCDKVLHLMKTHRLTIKK